MAKYQYPDRKGLPKNQHDLDQIGIGMVIFDTIAEDDHLPGLGTYVRGTTFTINNHKKEGE